MTMGMTVCPCRGNRHCIVRTLIEFPDSVRYISVSVMWRPTVCKGEFVQ